MKGKSIHDPIVMGHLSAPPPKMNDNEIRRNLHKKILSRHHASSKTLVIDELGLMHGAFRADIAVVNGRLTGYEIKSNADSLARLKIQTTAYNAVFDRVAIVVGERHRKAIASRVP